MLKSFIQNWSRNENGATMVEYGIAVVLAVVVGTSGFILLAGEINTNMSDASAEMATR